MDSYDGKIDEKCVDISDYDRFMLVNIEITNLYDKDRLYVLSFNDVVHYLEGTELDRFSLIAYNFEDNRPYFYRKDIKETIKNNGNYYYGEIILKANETVKLQAVMAYRGGDYNFNILYAIDNNPNTNWIGCTNELNAGYAADDGESRRKKK